MTLFLVEGYAVRFLPFDVARFLAAAVA